MPNPFTNFIADATATMRVSISSTQYGSLNPSHFEAFIDKANYARDIVSRVDELSFCYDRLCELSPIYLKIREDMQKNQPHPNAVDLSRVPPEVLERERLWKMEANVLTSFAFYELKSLADMLEQAPWSVSIPSGSELAYLLKARDRFLAHPQFRGVTRRVPSNMGIPVYGGLARLDLVSRNSSDPVTRAHYLGVLGLSGPVNETAQKQTNEQLIVSNKRNERFTPQEITRLKAFGIREPDLEKSLQELSQLLEQKMLPIIKQYFEDAINNWGFQRW